MVAGGVRVLPAVQPHQQQAVCQGPDRGHAVPAGPSARQEPRGAESVRRHSADDRYSHSVCVGDIR